MCVGQTGRPAQLPLIPTIPQPPAKAPALATRDPLGVKRTGINSLKIPTKG